MFYTYEEWLYESIDYEAHSDYSMLLSLLYSVDYLWIFERDKNRAEGGKNLRTQFSYVAGIDISELNQGPCNVLEALIAIADNMSLINGNSVSECFWEIVNNIGLMKYDDQHFVRNDILNLLNKWMSHNYKPDGKGSPFPIKNPTMDVRDMELWDQMNEYLTENYPLSW